MMRKLREGKLTEPNKENQENEACVFLQKRMRGILSRKYVERIRQEEMEFLGMVKRPKTAQERQNDPVKKMEETRRNRKIVQSGNWKQYL
jgi:predicted phosphohydrolase